jgi:hypothetical protein
MIQTSNLNMTLTLILIYQHRIIARNDIEKGKVVMSINRSAMLSAKFGKGPRSEIASISNQFADNLTLELAVLVLYHKCIPESFFKPFLDSLPVFYTVPVYWDLSIFKAFNGSSTMQRAINSLKSSAILFLRARQTIQRGNVKSFPLHYITWINFRWALAAVVTRQNNVPLPLDKMGTLGPNKPVVYPTLVPGWDLMNHEEGLVTSYFDIELDAVLYPSMKDFPLGSEVTMCYGSRSNDLLLVYSGFCIEDNPDESLDAELAIPRDEIARVRDMLIKTFSEETHRLLGKGDLGLGLEIELELELTVILLTLTLNLSPTVTLTIILSRILANSMRSTDGNIMYSVSKKDQGVIPINIIFSG